MIILKSVCVSNEDKFLNLDFKRDRVDASLGSFMNGKIKFSHLWTVCKFVFVLSHGQSQTERGFNINKTMLVENLQEESLKGQRIVYDHMSSLNTTIHKFVVTKELATHCKGAKYNATLQEKKNGKRCDDREKKRRLLSEEVAYVKCMKLVLLREGRVQIHCQYNVKMKRT